MPEETMILRTALMVCLFLSASEAAIARQATDIEEHTAAIAAGADTTGRRQAIVDVLRDAGIAYRLEEFTSSRYSGTNIVADIPGKSVSKVLLIGAHYDRVDVGQGAVDNAASCAALLELLGKFKADPLEHYSIRGVFFDFEEVGLVGSKAYLATLRDRQLPTEAINMDVFAYGDTLFATSSSLDGPLARTFNSAAKESSVPVRMVEPGRYPSSDHQPMIAAGIETLGVSLLDGNEIDPILQGAFQSSRVFTIIHTPRDTMEKVRPNDIEKALPVLEKTIRSLAGQ